jgi:hypothetical protein
MLQARPHAIHFKRILDFWRRIGVCIPHRGRNVIFHGELNLTPSAALILKRQRSDVLGQGLRQIHENIFLSVGHLWLSL